MPHQSVLRQVRALVANATPAHDRSGNALEVVRRANRAADMPTNRETIRIEVKLMVLDHAIKVMRLSAPVFEREGKTLTISVPAWAAKKRKPETAIVRTIECP
jgi:hypothetical protein